MDFMSNENSIFRSLPKLKCNLLFNKVDLIFLKNIDEVSATKFKYFSRDSF